MSEELILVFSIVMAQVASATVLSMMLFWFARTLSVINLRTWGWAGRRP